MLEVHLLAAALRADRTDVESYARILSDTLGQALPEGMVEVERRRRLRGDGEPVAVRVLAAGRELELRSARRGGVTAEIRQVVHGVVISRRAVGVDEWLGTLAEELTRLAERNATARDALARLLGG
ncbi:hypothetical protein [Amycolatopsis sp. GM8]|uniref:hypothetical protein n=1 Tax=Amycolatopsis sp. GM8 TaxID=2896530 RepID=UPI001F349E98|nr:hypothetical protein [Amycolatopsis sp. GM8]